MAAEGKEADWSISWSPKSFKKLSSCVSLLKKHVALLIGRNLFSNLVSHLILRQYSGFPKKSEKTRLVLIFGSNEQISELAFIELIEDSSINYVTDRLKRTALSKSIVGLYRVCK